VSTDPLASNSRVPDSQIAIVLYAGAFALGVLCLTLLVVSLRRMLGRHEEVVTTMLQRYDHRLAEFAQTLNDALNQTLPARITAAISGAPNETPSAAVEAPDHSNVVRVLELAREQTSADAAVAIVGTKQEPILATVGLSQSEVAQVGGLGVPDYRGARAIQVSFNGEDAPNGGDRIGGGPIRGGLAIPLLDSPTDPGMLAVLTRTADRRFSEIDITSLENVLSVTRPALETSLELREPDPVPERDPLTDLYDRPAFHALLDREIGRARGRREHLALLMLDVDRLTTINARIGHLAADGVLATIARVLNDVAGPRDLPCRIGGGCFGVLLSQADSRDAERLFEQLQAALRERPLPELGIVSFSGGVAELLANDDATALIVRADAALALAKSSGRDMVVTAAKRPTRDVA
jgi:diguanylate cyclase (GGDEF)-like protein